jgi:plasmid maintenance system antidote protein VapI
LTASEAATVLEVRRAPLSELINDNPALSVEMALRIEKPFGVKAGEIAVKPYRPPVPEPR